MGEPALTAEEASILASIVRGEQLDLRDRRLIRLARLRLIMVTGKAASFVPTALGYDWYRRFKEKSHGDRKESSPQGSAQEGCEA